MDPISIALLFGCVISTSIAIISNWEKLLIRVSGKKLLFLGDKATGKTTSIAFLTKNILATEYQATRYKQKTDERRFEIGDNDEKKWISLKHNFDIGGDTSFYAEWEKLFKESDWIFYMVQSKLLIDNDLDTKRRVEEDLDLIQDWRKLYDLKGEKKKLVIICTFCDQINELKKNIPRRIGGKELIKFFPVISKYGSGITVFLGSLCDEDNAKKLFDLVLRHML